MCTTSAQAPASSCSVRVGDILLDSEGRPYLVRELSGGPSPVVYLVRQVDGYGCWFDAYWRKDAAGFPLLRVYDFGTEVRTGP